MRIIKKRLLNSAAALALFSGSTAALAQMTPEEIITVDTEFAFESEYSFRGEKLGGPSLQPGMEIGIMDGYIGTWMSMPLDRTPRDGNEVDFYAGWVFPLSETVDLDVGYTYYWYPQPGGSDREPYIGVAIDTMLDPEVYLFYETEGEVFTVQGAVGYGYDLAEMGFDGYELDFGAYAGYVTNDDDYFYYGLSADIVYTLSESVAFSVGGRFAGNSDDDVVAGPQQQLWWGTAVSMAY